MFKIYVEGEAPLIYLRHYQDGKLLITIYNIILRISNFILDMLFSVRQNPIRMVLIQNSSS